MASTLAINKLTMGVVSQLFDIGSRQRPAQIGSF
jgi:hypothetical protein